LDIGSYIYIYKYIFLYTVGTWEPYWNPTGTLL
jgi:hypothetical protein